MFYDFVTLKCFVKMSPMKEMVTLNKKEQNRLIVLNRVERGMMTARQAAEIPGLSVRQINRTLAAYREETRGELNVLLEKYPSPKGFYRAKEKMRELYRQESREEAAKVLENIILNLKCAHDGELIKWRNTLKHWREPILNHFDRRTTNGFTKGCHLNLFLVLLIGLPLFLYYLRLHL